MKSNGFRGICGLAILVLTASAILQFSGCGDDGVWTPPPSAELADLTISVGTLSPGFSSGATFYSVNVAGGVASLTATPTASDASATITVDGTTVATGTASAAISLDPGVNFVFITVTATDSLTQELYVIAVTRTIADAELADLTISEGTLSPVFSPDATSYSVDVPSSVVSLTATPTASAAGATITVDGVAVASGAPSGAIPLDPGMNFLFIVVTATDGITQELYTIAVTRAIADAELADLTISEGTLSPVFSPASTFYVAECILPAAITVTPTASDSGATITVNGVVVDSGTPSQAISLAQGSNVITVIVTAADGVTQMGYTVVVFGYGQRTYLKASNTDAQDSFGWSVAVDGDTIVVGACSENSSAKGVDGDQANNSAIAAGAAYVFTRTGGIWSQQAYLKASNTDEFDGFGISVAIDDDTIVVGAYREASNATDVDGDQTDDSMFGGGAAYVFIRAGGVWSQQAYLKASNTEADDYFGRSVSVSSDTIIVGANGEDSNATGVDGDQSNNGAAESGAAYVFTRTGIIWSQQAYLKASNTDADDFFALDVANDGNTIVVGAYREDSHATGVDGDQTDDSATTSGAAYVFTRSGVVWSQEAYLKASNTDAGDCLGLSVDVDGDTIIAGAYGEASSATGVDGNQTDNGTLGSGAAYVFTRTGIIWSQQAYLKASNAEADDYFGVSVAIDGDTVVVGAEAEDSSATGVDGNQADNSSLYSGAAYMFTRTGGVWSQQAYLKASYSSSSGDFGTDVAVAGDSIVVGANYERSAATGVNGNQADTSAVAAGAAYVFE